MLSSSHLANLSSTASSLFLQSTLVLICKPQHLHIREKQDLPSEPRSPGVNIFHLCHRHGLLACSHPASRRNILRLKSLYRPWLRMLHMLLCVHRKQAPDAVPAWPGPVCLSILPASLVRPHWPHLYFWDSQPLAQC